MSEFQLQEKGCKIDSKAKGHGGKQTFWPTGQEDVEIPLTVKGALIHLKHRYPTTDEPIDYRRNGTMDTP